MKKHITINLIIEDGKVIDMDLIDNYGRTEFVADGIDEPITIVEALEEIKKEL